MRFSNFRLTDTFFGLALAAACLGQVDSVQKFDVSRDETLAYQSWLINSSVDAEEYDYFGNSPRKDEPESWLTPIPLIRRSDDDDFDISSGRVTVTP